MLKPRPIIAKSEIVVPLPSLGEPTVLVRKYVVGEHRRKLLDARRMVSAEVAIRDLAPGLELVGFTKGQFSLLDLIKATAKHIGPSHLHISTWTAALSEVGELAVMHKRGVLLSTRWLADISLGGRDRGVMQAILHHFGKNSVRVTKNHSKFCVFINDEWRLVLLSSMNLNMNPRMENFSLSNDPELAAWLLAFLDEIWGKQTYDIDNSAKHRREFQSGEI